jgi:hypothetical protein
MKAPFGENKNKNKSFFLTTCFSFEKVTSFFFFSSSFFFFEREREIMPSKGSNLVIKHKMLNQVSSIVSFDENHKCFTVHLKTNKRAKGLTKLLGKAFWPDYQYPVYKQGLEPKSGFPKDKLKNELGGLVRGKVIHGQVRALIEGPNYSSPLGEFFGLHPYSQKTVNALKLQGLTPIIAELPVCYPDLLVATAIDIVCLDSADRPVFVELKTGMDNTFTAGNQKMKGPWNASNCALNQAFVQLLIGIDMYESITSSRVHKGIVLHVKDSGATIDELPSDLLKLRPAVRKHLHTVYAQHEFNKKLKRKVRTTKKKIVKAVK